MYSPHLLQKLVGCMIHLLHLIKGFFEVGERQTLNERCSLSISYTQNDSHSTSEEIVMGVFSRHSIGSLAIGQVDVATQPCKCSAYCGCKSYLRHPPSHPRCTCLVPFSGSMNGGFSLRQLLSLSDWLLLLVKPHAIIHSGSLDSHDKPINSSFPIVLIGHSLSNLDYLKATTTVP